MTVESFYRVIFQWVLRNSSVVICNRRAFLRWASGPQPWVQPTYNADLLPSLLPRLSISCSCHVWPDWAIFERSWWRISYKSSPNIWQLIEAILKNNDFQLNCCDNFCSTFGGNLATVYFNIRSHCSWVSSANANSDVLIISAWDEYFMNWWWGSS